MMQMESSSLCLSLMHPLEKCRRWRLQKILAKIGCRESILASSAYYIARWRFSVYHVPDPEKGPSDKLICKNCHMLLCPVCPHCRMERRRGPEAAKGKGRE